MGGERVPFEESLRSVNRDAFCFFPTASPKCDLGIRQFNNCVISSLPTRECKST
jgi:hypothetical protein